jgi:hypothetical protein
MRRQQHEDDEAFDERGILRDGYSVRSPMMMRDAETLTDVQRSIAGDRTVRRHWEDSADQHFGRTVKVTDAAGGTRGLHRAGARVDATVSFDERQRAYEIYDQELADAHKHTGDAWPRDAKVGDPCTVKGKEFVGSFGAPGTLQLIAGQLVCVPTRSKAAITPAASHKDHKLVMDALYREHDLWLEAQYLTR